MAAQLGTNQMTVSRVWTRHGLQPHRLRRYMLSEDPDFEKKAADILSLYFAAATNLYVRNPPERFLTRKPFCIRTRVA